MAKHKSKEFTALEDRAALLGFRLKEGRDGVTVHFYPPVTTYRFYIGHRGPLGVKPVSRYLDKYEEWAKQNGSSKTI